MVSEVYWFENGKLIGMRADDLSAQVVKGLLKMKDLM